MSRRVTWDRRALTDPHGIVRRDQRQGLRIRDAVEHYAEHDRGDIRKLAGGSDEYRLRVGDWCILVKLEDDRRLMAVSRVLDRRDEYR